MDITQVSPGPAPRAHGPSKRLEACWHSQSSGPISWQTRRTASPGQGTVPRDMGQCLGLGFHHCFGAVSCYFLRGQECWGPRRWGEAPVKMLWSGMAPTSLCEHLCPWATMGQELRGMGECPQTHPKSNQPPCPHKSSPWTSPSALRHGPEAAVNLTSLSLGAGDQGRFISLTLHFPPLGGEIGAGCTAEFEGAT